MRSVLTPLVFYTGLATALVALGANGTAAVGFYVEGKTYQAELFAALSVVNIMTCVCLVSLYRQRCWEARWGLR